MLYTSELYKLSKSELLLLVKELLLNCETTPAVDYIKSEALHDEDYFELMTSLIEYKSI